MSLRFISAGTGWYEIGAGVLFALWFLISVPNQFSGERFEWVKRWNGYLLIPGWTFFAPNPGVSNYRYVVRDILLGGRMTEWQEIDWCEERHALHAVWHPARHRTKLIVDCINGLILTIRDLEKRGVDFREHPETYMVSTPYLALLHIAVRNQPQDAAAVSRQFAIIEQFPSSTSGLEPRLILCSPPHDL